MRRGRFTVPRDLSRPRVRPFGGALMVGAGVADEGLLTPATVTVDAAGTPQAGWDSAVDLNIEHDDAGSSTATIHLLNASGTTGVIVHFPGADGTATWDPGAVADDYLADLVAADWVVIDTDHTSAGGWPNGPDDVMTGLNVMASRSAGLIQYIYDTYVVPILPGGLYYVVGSSGGAGQIMYAHTWYGMGDIIDGRFQLDGPPFTDLTRYCSIVGGFEDWRADNDTQASYVDIAHGYDGAAGDPCIDGDTSGADFDLWATTGIKDGPRHTWPGRHIVLIGGTDTTVAGVQGHGFCDDYLTDWEQSFERYIVEDTGHGISNTALGMLALREAVFDNIQHIQMKAGSTTAVTTDITVTYDRATTVGNTLVACHSLSGATIDDTDVEPPGGWTLIDQQQNTSCTAGIWVKTADGTETDVVFGNSGVTSVHNLTIFELPPVTLDVSDPGTSAATPCPMSTVTTTVPKTWAVAIAVIAANRTVDNPDNGFTQRFESVRGSVSTKSIEATGTVSVNVPWQGSATTSAGVLAVFKAA